MSKTITNKTLFFMWSKITPTAMKNALIQPKQGIFGQSDYT